MTGPSNFWASSTMRFKIQCSNFSDFDPAAGKYVRCGEMASVSSDQVGQFVSCKKCGQQIEVIAQSASPKPAPAKQRPAGKSKRVRQPVSKGTQGDPSPSNDGDLRMAAPLKRERSDVMSMSFGDEQVASTLTEDQHERCSKCGNISKSGKCTVCHHVEQSFKRRKQPDDVKIQLVGFQRWFCRTVNEGVSIKFLEMGFNIGLGLLAAGTTLLSILSICGVGFGIVAGIVLLLLTICASLLYISMIIKGRQFTRDPGARLAWYQKPFWYAILAMARAMNWQNYDSKLKDRRITKVRDKMFGDAELAAVEGLKNCEVLDLEGTRVTDATIQMLYGHKHLRCLVLKGTNTTHEAVFRFQQSHPRLWIWE